MSSQLTNLVFSGSRPIIFRTTGWSTRKVGNWRAMEARKPTSMSQSCAASVRPLSRTGRFSNCCLRLSVSSGNCSAMADFSSAVQVEGFLPKAVASSSVRAISRRARIWSKEPLASVSKGMTRPPLCTGSVPISRLSQASAACASVGFRAKRATRPAVAAVFPRRLRKLKSETPKWTRRPSDISETEM